MASLRRGILPSKSAARLSNEETAMLTGLSAFPLTPMNESAIDEAAFLRLVERLAAAGVDSIGALGSTGNYAYLTRAEPAC